MPTNDPSLSPPPSSSLSSSQPLDLLNFQSPSTGSHTPLNNSNTIADSSQTIPPNSQQNLIDSDHLPATSPLQSSNLSGNKVSSAHQTVSQETDGGEMIAVQTPSTFPHRGSFMDMDEDELSPSTSQRGSRASVLNSFRRLVGQSRSQIQSTSPTSPKRQSVTQTPLTPESLTEPQLQSPATLRPSGNNTDMDSKFTPASPASSTYPTRSSEENAKHPFPQFSFTFPLASPPASPNPSRQSRPSLEGVFDTPSPPSRFSREFQSTSPLSPRTPEINTHRLSSATGSSGSSRGRRTVPKGENPLIFGNVTPRRISKSSPLQPNLDTSQKGLRAPTLSVTGPTPQPSPAKSPLSENPMNIPFLSPSTPGPNILKPSIHSKTPSPPKTVTYDDNVKDESGKTKGKRKSEELDKELGEENPPEKKDSTIRRGSLRISNTSSTSNPPVSFNSASKRTSKRIKLSSGLHTPAQSHAQGDSTVSSSPEDRLASPPSRPSSLRPSSRGSGRPKSSSIFPSNSSHGTLPISAIVSPRPPSVGLQSYDYGRREEGLYMRDPRRETRRVGWGIHLKHKQLKETMREKGTNISRADYFEIYVPTPPPGLLFYPAFIFPPLWWIGSLLPGQRKKEQVRIKWDKRTSEIEKAQQKVFKTWRDRCRLMALVSLVTYLPLIVLLAVFIPR